MSFWLGLKILTMSAIFVITSGAFFTDYGRNKPILMVLVFIVATLSTFYLGRAIYEDIKDDFISAMEEREKQKRKEVIVQSKKETEKVQPKARELEKSELNKQRKPKKSPTIKQVTAKKTKTSDTAWKHGYIFKDCKDCPSMIVVKAGSFMMGFKGFKGRNPDKYRRKVTIPKLAVGRFEIDFDEWEDCVKSKGCSHKPIDQGSGRGNHPVINVSWEDAQSYVQWLSRKTGQTYRLLTEAEWEYVARAGTDTRYWFGDIISKTDANYEGNNNTTSPVGYYKANPWGLYNVHGNVWEWVEDCWHEDYKNAPGDGRARLKENGGDCSLRVFRGGSWNTFYTGVTSYHRDKIYFQRRIFDVGFRIARDLD